MSAALRFHLYLEELVLAGELEPDVLLDDVDKGEGEDEAGSEEEYEVEMEDDEVEDDEVEDDDLADNGEVRPPLFRGPFLPGERFNLLLVDDNEAKEQLRFDRNDIINIAVALRLPDLIVTRSRDKVWYDEYPGMPDHEARYNKVMSEQRCSIEWEFGEITRYFGALNYRRQQQLLKSPVEYHYRAMALMTNIRTCIYGNQLALIFALTLLLWTSI
ncbi:MAG: hypothetical protein JOS17DRAFT_799346 [Linnemannia elongata]|nr:MAG: hypothetical protein JOS17DRAFT_799346 [Linnemannia elongata]